MLKWKRIILNFVIKSSIKCSFFYFYTYYFVRTDLKEDKEDKLEKISISNRLFSSGIFPPNKYSNFIAILFDFILSIWARLLLFFGSSGCSLTPIHLYILPSKIVINDGRLSKCRDHSHIKETIRSSVASLHLRNDWHAREYNLFIIFIFFQSQGIHPGLSSSPWSSLVYLYV